MADRIASAPPAANSRRSPFSSGVAVKDVTASASGGSRNTIAAAIVARHKQSESVAARL